MRLELLVLFILLHGAVLGQCADSAVNCTGECGQFVDDNDDGYCDDSIIDSAVIQKVDVQTVEPVHTQPVAAVGEQSSVPILTSETDDPDPKPAIRDPGAVTKTDSQAQRNDPPVQRGDSQAITVASKQLAYVQPRRDTKEEAGQHRRGKRYDYSFLAIVLPLAAGYSLLHVLNARKVIARSTLLRILNTGLLVSFLVCALLGLLITVKLVYDLQLPQIKAIYTLHVDFGVAMAVIALIHLALHWKYYRNMLRS